MRIIYLISAVGILALVLIACGEKKHAAEAKKKRTDIIVHDDQQKLSEMIRLSAPVTSVRWAVVPVVVGQSRLAIGPSDYSLYVVVTFDSAQWPAWERALTPAPADGDYFLMEEVAEKLLPPDWNAPTVPDSLGGGRRLEGAFYKPDSAATSVYRSGSAVRHGNHLFMSFYTM